MVQIIKNSRVVSQSKNLRGIVAYARQVKLASIVIQPKPDLSASLAISWVDGATCFTNFASYTVCQHWCNKKTIRLGWPIASTLLK